jgi:hypothetical protein
LITGELYPFAPPKDEETGRIDVSALFAMVLEGARPVLPQVRRGNGRERVCFASV